MRVCYCGGARHTLANILGHVPIYDTLAGILLFYGGTLNELSPRPHFAWSIYVQNKSSTWFEHLEVGSRLENKCTDKSSSTPV